MSQMLTHYRTFRKLFLLSLQKDRTSTLILLVLFAVRAVNIPLSAIAIGWLLNSVQAGIVLFVAAASLLTGFASGIQFVVSRAVLNLQEDMSHKVELILKQEIIQSVAAPLTIDSFWDATFLDSVAALRRDVYPLANYLWRVIETILSLFALALSVGLMVVINPILIFLSLLAVAPLIGNLLGQRVLQDANMRIAPLLRLETAIHELTTNPLTAKEILIFGSVPALDAHARKLWGDAIVIRTRAQIAAGGMGMAGWTLFAVALVGSLFVIGEQTSRGDLSIGTFAVIITLSTRIKGQISEALYGLAGVGESGELIDHFERLGTYSPNKLPPATTGSVGLSSGIEFVDVSFSYPNQSKASLQNICLAIPAGTCVSVVGLNGSGKSTLINLALGLTEPTEGQILRAKESAAYSAAFQDFMRPLLTAREAVALGSPAHMGDVDAITGAIARAQASPVIDQLDAGLDTQLGVAFGGVEMSQGQWQKLALARAMMRSAPAVLAFDEPTSALDPQAEHDLFRLLMIESRHLGRQHGTITFFVSHRFSSADLADLVLVIADGTIVESGSHDDLIELGGRYAEYFALQRDAYINDL